MHRGAKTCRNLLVVVQVCALGPASSETYPLLNSSSLEVPGHLGTGRYRHCLVATLRLKQLRCRLDADLRVLVIGPNNAFRLNRPSHIGVWVDIGGTRGTRAEDPHAHTSNLLEVEHLADVESLLAWVNRLLILIERNWTVRGHWREQVHCDARPGLASC